MRELVRAYLCALVLCVYAWGYCVCVGVRTCVVVYASVCVHVRLSVRESIKFASNPSGHPSRHQQASGIRKFHASCFTVLYSLSSFGNRLICSDGSEQLVESGCFHHHISKRLSNIRRHKVM